MAIFCESNKKIKNIFINVNGEKKSVKSVWVNKDGVPTKVFQLNDETKQDPYEVAPVNEYLDWNYVLDDENKIITLCQYKNETETDVVVYANYIVNSRTYKTQLANFGYPGSGGYSYSYMFGAKNKIETIKFSNGLDTSNVKSMMEMFRGCTSLINLDLSVFNTVNVTNMNYMFSDCKLLQNVNLKNFNTSSTTSMREMFCDCVSLTELDLSSFNTCNVMNMNYMFDGTSNLRTIYVTNEKWSISNATTVGMFSGCGTSEVTYI